VQGVHQEAATPGKALPPVPTPDPAQAKPVPLLQRDLIEEAKRAELDAGGILIDLGSVDMHKYSRGGWLSGWSRNTLEGETRVSRIDARSAWLDIVSESPTQEIVVRAKGRGMLGVAVGKGPARSVSLSTDFEVHRIQLPKALAPGRHRISLVGRKASVDWLWLSHLSGKEPPSLQRVSADGTGLVAQGERSYRYYLLAGAQSRLKFRLSGDPGATGTIRAQGDGVPPMVLWQGKVEDGKPPQYLPLPAALAGKPMQLRLESQGALAWHDLALVRESPDAAALSKAPKNVILLLIDTQRADSFSVVNPTGAVGADAYEALVKTSTTFKNAYNSENWTKPSIATIDTGLYPTTHLARWRKDKCSSDLHFLSEHLKDAGFDTAALVSNMSAGPKYGFNQGWAHFEKTDNAKQAFGRAMAWLDGRDKSNPYFLFVQTIDPHVPFSVPEGSAEALYGGEYAGKLGPSFEQSEEDALNDGSLKLSEADARWLRALYDAEVLYHDDQLGKFMAGLAERRALEDTVFVILNDHGEEFGEHGRWGHSWTMGDALHRSPLLMHLPGFFPAETVSSVVEHVDVAPTIVASLGLPEMAAAEGKSLLPLVHKQEHPGLRSALLFGRKDKRGLRVGDYKLVLEGNRKATLFDTAHDPNENTDLLASHAIAHRLCEVALGEAIANPKKSERLHDRSERLKIRAQYIPE
jgi:arylsulfatase A-like enzyme